MLPRTSYLVWFNVSAHMLDLGVTLELNLSSHFSSVTQISFSLSFSLSHAHTQIQSWRKHTCGSNQTQSWSRLNLSSLHKNRRPCSLVQPGLDSCIYEGICDHMVLSKGRNGLLERKTHIRTCSANLFFEDQHAVYGLTLFCV